MKEFLSRLGLVVLVSLVYLLPSISSHSVLVQSNKGTKDFAGHPLIDRINNVYNNFNPVNPPPDPDSYWMKQFLNEVIKTSDLPTNAVTIEQLKSNILRLAEYDSKGWLREVARGKIDISKLDFPDECYKPLIVRGYVPVVTPNDPEPVIELHQKFGDQHVYKEVPTHRNKRSADGYEEQEEIEARAFHMDEYFGDDIEYADGHENHMVDEDISDESGKLTRQKREAPTGFGIYPGKNTAVFVTGIQVKIDSSGDIVWPNAE